MPNNQDFFSLLSLVFRLGYSLIVPLIIGILGGVWLDRRFSTTPWFTLAGVILGLITSGYILYSDVLPYINKKSKKD